MVFNELESPWAIEIIRGVEEVAREHELGVVLSAQEGPGALGRSWVDAVASRRTGGVILVVSELSEEQAARLRARSIPFVVVDPAGEPAPGVPVGGRHQLERRAHRHAPPARARPPAHRHDRRAGRRCSAAARARTAIARRSRRPACPSTRSSSATATSTSTAPTRRGARCSRCPTAPTAIFAGSDLQAFGLYEAARVLGLRVPDDLSVIGFDDLPMARWAWPPLTTIRQPLTEMAATATRIVLGDDTQTRVELATSLVVRQSTVAREP